MTRPDFRAARRLRPETQFPMDADEVTLLRRLMTGLAMHRACPRGDCRRARACAGPALPCLWANRDALQETVWPKLRALAEASTDDERTLPVLRQCDAPRDAMPARSLRPAKRRRQTRRDGAGPAS